MSFESPEYTANADALGALRILEAIRFNNLENKTKFYQAGTLRTLWIERKKSLKMKKLTFIPQALMELQNCMHIGLQLITEKHIIYLLLMGFYLTMKVQEEVRLLLHKKSFKLCVKLN